MAAVPTTSPHGIPLTDVERRIWADIAWAEQDPEVQRNYAGQWVVILDRKILAHARDRDQALQAAGTALQQPVDDLVVWPIPEGTSLLSDSPPAPTEY